MYSWAVFFHLILVSFWLGGMLFTAAVLVPATRKKLAGHKTLLFTELGYRFSRLSWIIFPLLVLTGILALTGRDFALDTILSADFWKTTYGGRLFIKLHVFGLVLIVSGIHDFWLGPKAVQLMDSEPGTSKCNIYRKATSWIGRVNLILGLVILAYAVKLVRL